MDVDNVKDQYETLHDKGQVRKLTYFKSQLLAYLSIIRLDPSVIDAELANNFRR